ncbi:uracil nucleotide/cysteinyl leukotriene receptor [Latimeria chalumnae]|uniref:Uracil nucleotide/cysteinyl leukotriene receptor n=1 Tax=Latimeria chalumnae TaxID=7897 RepID=H3B9B7_LATCH|nr:PREDICTED: uracil nucleotide/cysteinyl leukotriene receptor [Latimeria chalumnae]|eukprot:XP_005991263.1 PREDICTED: uracil nucleotide/cysteinyl leukotriene receptor [Latimeria chalumnae]
MNLSAEFSGLPSNSSEQCIKESSIENILFALYYLADFIVAFFGSTLALCFFIYNRKSTTTANVFLMHLAAADLSYVMILPMRLIYHLKGSQWSLGEIPCRLSGFLFYLNMYASIYFMTCISADRFLAIVFPVKSMQIRKPIYAHITSGILWVIVTIAMSPLLVTQQTVQINNATVCLQLYREKASQSALVSITIAFSIPFFITVFCYLVIIHKLKKGKRMENGVKDKAIKMIILVLTIFLTCFVPYHINRYIYILYHNAATASCDMQRALALSNRITSSLTSLNGALDPIMYFFVAEKFRETIFHLFCRKKGAIVSQVNESKTNDTSLSAKSEL